MAGASGLLRHSQPWPRWSGSWHPGTGQVRQAAGQGWGGQWGRWDLQALLTLQGRTPGWGQLLGTDPLETMQ